MATSDVPLPQHALCWGPFSAHKGDLDTPTPSLALQMCAVNSMLMVCPSKPCCACPQSTFFNLGAATGGSHSLHMSPLLRMATMRCTRVDERLHTVLPSLCAHTTTSKLICNGCDQLPQAGSSRRSTSCCTSAQHTCRCSRRPGRQHRNASARTCCRRAPVGCVSRCSCVQ